MDKSMKYAIAAVVLLFLLVIGASMSNSSHFYLKPADGVLEVWQGKFAPMGEKKVLALEGVAVPETIKESYAKGEVYPLVFSYYLDKADALLDAPGLPDFPQIQAHLNKALSYGVTADLRNAALSRLAGVDLMVLLYKADVAAAKGTADGLEKAISLMGEANRLNITDDQEKLVAQKIASFETALAGMAQPEATDAGSEEAAPAESASTEPAPNAQTAPAEGGGHN